MRPIPIETVVASRDGQNKALKQTPEVESEKQFEND